mgnify:CR=1 FL=1
MTAGQAQPGFYRTPRGRLVRVVRRADVTSRWPDPPGRDLVPYRSVPEPGDDLARMEVFGWLPLGYQVAPAEAPPVVAEAIAERAAVFRERLAGAARAPRGRDPRLPAAGTELRRKYKGADYQVRVLETGVEYDGKVYASISAAGAAIVDGTCNGFVFFGLTKKETTQCETPTTTTTAPSSPTPEAAARSGARRGATRATSRARSAKNRTA